MSIKPRTMNPNIYTSYKRDSRYLFHWMVNVSNRLINTSNEGASKELTINTTGEITVQAILSMAKLIADRSEHVPDLIYGFFVSIIRTRSLVSESYEEMAESDPSLKQSNESHRYFIDALKKAFNILGGEAWEDAQGASGNNDDLDDDALKNKFEALKVDHIEASSTEGSSRSSPERNKPQRRGKGKKYKKPKTPKTPKFNREVPLESVRMLETEESNSEYLIAVYAMAKEWIELRNYVRHTWKQVAYEGENSAVAAGVSKLAISMVKRTAATTFIDFPRYGNHETIVSKIIGGDFDKPCGKFNLTIISAQGSKTQALDPKEHFLTYAYRHLKEFIVDFQKNRTGKPTKNLLKRLNKWDPDLDLQTATVEERLDWRRDYTIKWLFDLINVYASAASDTERHKPEEFDWSLTGPLKGRRSLFGLNEFAAAVTSIAMKKQGSDIGKLIEPQLVFELQIIIDAFTVSKGWSLDASGHFVGAPANNFQPRRDVDLFLGKNTTRPGFCESTESLQQLIERSNRMKKLQKGFDTLESAQRDFATCLGEYKGTNAIPPSQFSKTNSNGLYDYSPYLCGDGVEEAIGIAFRTCMKFWNDMSEPSLLLLLHKVLVRNGSIKKPIELCQDLNWVLEESFFPSDVSAYFRNADHPSNIRPVSLLTSCQDADWNTAHIPDDEVALGSGLFMARIADTKQTGTGESTRFENTPLVQRAKKFGFTNSSLAMATTQFSVLGQLGTPRPEAAAGSSDEGSKGKSPATSSSAKKIELAPTTLIALMKRGLTSDICGSVDRSKNRPFSTLNYASISCWAQTVFLAIEERLREINSPILRGDQIHKDKRVNMVRTAIAESNQPCFEIMAEVFNQHRCDFKSHAYWEDLEEVAPTDVRLRSAGYQQVHMDGHKRIIIR